MIPNDRGRTIWNDDEVDALLVDFFAREMPAELQRLSGDSVPAAIANGHSMPHRRHAPGHVNTSPSRAAPRPMVRLAALAVAVLVAVALFQAQFGPAGKSDAVRSGVAEVPGNETDGGATAETRGPGDLDYSVTERLEPVESLTYETGRGPVEQRTNVRVTNVSVFEPASGAKVEVELEELNIEIIPIDD